MNLLLGLTGSVACIKLLEMLQYFLDNAQVLSTLQSLQEEQQPGRFSLMSQQEKQSFSFRVRIVATENAFKFIDKLPKEEKDQLEVLMKKHSVQVLGEEDEWAWKGKGDEVTHIELRKWADCLLIAPLSANSLAKLANGLCDNLLSCVFRAWDFSDKKKCVVVAPAMNPCMYNSPFTQEHLSKLNTFGVFVIKPVVKTLVCGDQGVGALAKPFNIFRFTILAILQKDLSATVEYLQQRLEEVNEGVEPLV